MALVEIRKLTKQFRKGDEKITPLDGVDLDIEQGEFVVLMGPSGTGKSTLLNLVAGIDRADEGTINVAGTEVTRLSRSKLADWRAAHLGYIFQTHNLIPVLTTYENVELPLLLLPMSGGERQKRVEVALEAVGLTDRADHYPRQLSGGQEQRVGIARAIVANPTVIVADEPTGSLDAATSEQIQVLLKRLNRELGMTMLMVTHDDSVAAIGSRWLSLDRGRMVPTDRPTVSHSVPSLSIAREKIDYVSLCPLCHQKPSTASRSHAADGQRRSGGSVCILFCRLGPTRSPAAHRRRGCTANADRLSRKPFLPN
jgi:putative ABC transport system ATP-binding protein